MENNLIAVGSQHYITLIDPRSCAVMCALFCSYTCYHRTYFVTVDIELHHKIRIGVCVLLLLGLNSLQHRSAVLEFPMGPNFDSRR